MHFASSAASYTVSINARMVAHERQIPTLSVKILKCTVHDDVFTVGEPVCIAISDSTPDLG